MPVKPSDLLRFAKQVDRSSEAACRAAVSRAYYCAYHQMVEIAANLPPTATYKVPGHIRHSEVRDRLWEWKLPERLRDAAAKSGDIAVVKRAYKAALAARAMADYNLIGTVRPDDVQLQVERVDPILQFGVRFALASQAAGSPATAVPTSAPKEDPRSSEAAS